MPTFQNGDPTKSPEPVRTERRNIGERVMSPYAISEPSQILAELESSILSELDQSPGRPMRYFLEKFGSYSSADVKGAVWHLIDAGRVRLEADRRLVRAA